MSLISQFISGMFGGVSQQSDIDRLPNQAESQTNCINRVSNGSGKRPPMEHMGKVSDAPFGRAYFHTINRDLYERYNVVVTDGNIQVFNAETGEAKVVGFPDGKSYLNSSDPKYGFSLVTVADYTFVVNKEKTVQMDTNSSAPGSIDGTYQDMVEAKRDDDAANGERFLIRGSRTNLFDEYVVQKSGSSFQEVAEPGMLQDFDKSTMPHVLIRQADGTFTFQKADWASRDVGNDTTNPKPSFVDNTVSDVFFYQNRLCFLSRESVIMSRAGAFFNFWRETATDLLDTDPIDLAVSGTTVNWLHHGVPFNRTLMLFSGQNQFMMNHGQVLSPRSVTADPATAYDASTRVKPVGLGPSVFFPVASGGYTTIREYFVQEGQASNSASDVTSHVPQYIPEDISSLAAATNESMLFVQVNSEVSTLYVYKMDWSNNKRVQSAWSKWTFPGEVLSAAVLDNYLMVLTEHSDGVHLGRINLKQGQTALGLDYDIHLDRRVEIEGTYEAAEDETRFELPYNLDSEAELKLVYGSEFSEAGQVTDAYRIDSNLYAINGDYSGGTCALGLPYTQEHVFSRIYYRQRDNSVASGRLQLRNMYLSFVHTGYFRLEVSRNNTVSREATIAPGFTDSNNGRLVGSDGWTLDSPKAGEGTVRLPVRGNTAHLRIALKNDSPYPSHFVSAQWNGELVTNARV